MEGGGKGYFIHEYIFLRKLNISETIYNRGYYTVAQRYEFYFRVAKTMLFLPLENKIHIFKPPCNFLSSLVRIWKIRHSGPGCTVVSYEFYE